MYNFDNANDSSGKPGFPLGEDVDNVTIKSAEYSVSSGGNEAIKLVFERNGAELLDFVFPVSDSFVKRNNPDVSGQELEDLIQKQKDSLASKLLHVLTKFDLTKEKLIELFQAKSGGDTSFKGFADFFCAVIAKKNTDPKPKFYMKTLRNKKGYVSVPPYAGFLQRMDSGECKLGWSQYEKDLIERNTTSQPKAASTEVVEDTGSKLCRVLSYIISTRNKF
jgi:hypothetical protein